MREATGGATLFYIVIFIITIIILLLISSISYSKAYRVKNRIVDIIEKYECYEDCDGKVIAVTNKDNPAVEEINDTLAAIGYKVNPLNSNWECPTRDGELINNSSVGNNYRYCVYKVNSQRGYYYNVVSYMYLEVPLIGSTIDLPVYGATKTIYTNNGEV